MIDPVWQWIVTGAVGISGGVMGSIVGPWVSWGIEKKRLLREDRKEKLRSWRTYLEGRVSEGGYKHATAWAEMRPYLSESTVRKVEQYNDWTNILTNLMTSFADLRQAALVDLAKLEKKWNLL